MGYVKCRRTTTPKINPENFLEEIRSVVEVEDVLLDLIFNWDQTGLDDVPVANFHQYQGNATLILTYLKIGTLYKELKKSNDQCHLSYTTMLRFALTE